jgi:hypothetical protein
MAAGAFALKCCRFDSNVITEMKNKYDIVTLNTARPKLLLQPVATGKA